MVRELSHHRLEEVGEAWVVYDAVLVRVYGARLEETVQRLDECEMLIQLLRQYGLKHINDHHFAYIDEVGI